MPKIQKGVTFDASAAGKQVTAARLNALVDDAIILSGAITEQTEKALPVAEDDYGLIFDAAGNALKKVRVGRMGNVVQTVHAALATHTSTTVAIPLDDTIPQNTEGAEAFTLAITPKSASSQLYITVIMHTYFNRDLYGTIALFKDAIANALKASFTHVSAGGGGGSIMSMQHKIASGSATLQTFKIRYGPHSSAGTMVLNGIAGARYFGGVNSCTMTIEERIE